MGSDPGQPIAQHEISVSLLDVKRRPFAGFKALAVDTKPGSREGRRRSVFTFFRSRINRLSFLTLLRISAAELGGERGLGVSPVLPHGNFRDRVVPPSRRRRPVCAQGLTGACSLPSQGAHVFPWKFMHKIRRRCPGCCCPVYFRGHHHTPAGTNVCACVLKVCGGRSARRLAAVAASPPRAPPLSSASVPLRPDYQRRSCRDFHTHALMHTHTHHTMH